MQNKLFKKFMEYGVGSILTLLIGFISSPIITRLITPEQNGKFSMFTTIGNLLLMVVVLGLDQSYVRYFYEEKETNRGILLKKCIITPVLISIVISLIMILFYKNISTFILGTKSFFVVVLLGIFLLINVIFRFALLQVRMEQKGKLYSVINIIQKSTNLIAVILFFCIFKNSYFTLIFAIILSTLISVIVAVVLEKDSWKKCFSKNKINTSNKELVKYGVPLIFTMAITWVFQSTDRIIIKEFSGYLELGLYNGAMTIIALLNAVQSTFTTFWTPVAFEKYSKEPEDKDFFKKINEIVTFFMLLIALGLISCKDIIVLLLGAKYREAVFIFPFLVFMPIMYTISETTVLGINFKKNPKEHIKVASISAIFNILGNLLLVPKFGAIGAAISTGLSYVIFFIFRTYYGKKYYNVKFELKKFFIIIIFIYILAIYSSFNTFNIVIFFMTIIIFAVIIVSYKNIIKSILDIVKEKRYK